jgi:hypothetical protein
MLKIRIAQNMTLIISRKVKISQKHKHMGLNHNNMNTNVYGKTNTNLKAKMIMKAVVNIQTKLGKTLYNVTNAMVMGILVEYVLLKGRLI